MPKALVQIYKYVLVVVVVLLLLSTNSLVKEFMQLESRGGAESGRWPEGGRVRRREHTLRRRPWGTEKVQEGERETAALGLNMLSRSLVASSGPHDSFLPFLGPPTYVLLISHSFCRMAVPGT